MKGMENIVFELISRSGTARSDCFEALHHTRNGEIKEALEKLKNAEQELTKAHHVQTDLIQKEVRGEKQVELSFLMIHAQDHLMTSMLAKDLIEEMIKIYEFNFELEKKLTIVREVC